MSAPRSRFVLAHALASAAFALAFAFAPLQPARAQAQPAHSPIELRDDRGRQVTLPVSPRRVVSLLPSLTESVCVLGACDLLVGVDRYSNWPSEVRRLPKLGGLEDPLIERVAALKPDLVLASTSARLIERLEGLGIKVIALNSDNRADVKRALDVLAKAFGKPQQADIVWEQIMRDERAAIERVPLAWRGKRAYFEVDSSLYAAGEGSFIGETLSRLGIGNIATKDLGPFPKLNPEFVVRAQPDVVIAQKTNTAEMRKRPGWNGLRALRDGEVCAFEPAAYELLIRPGPRMGVAAQSLAECIAKLPPPKLPNAPGVAR